MPLLAINIFIFSLGQFVVIPILYAVLKVHYRDHLEALFPAIIRGNVIATVVSAFALPVLFSVFIVLLQVILPSEARWYLWAIGTIVWLDQPVYLYNVAVYSCMFFYVIIFICLVYTDALYLKIHIRSHQLSGVVDPFKLSVLLNSYSYLPLYLAMLIFVLWDY